jgi:hypothetical protein
MGASPSPDHVAAFTEELLRTGLMLEGLAAELVEAIPPDAYPGEDPAAVVIEMVTGTIATALSGTDQPDLQMATELMAAARERVVEHLQLALALSRRLDDTGPEHPRRTYG